MTPVIGDPFHRRTRSCCGKMCDVTSWRRQSMLPLIETRRSDIADLCQRFRISLLDGIRIGCTRV
jgi:hypothetical protein